MTVKHSLGVIVKWCLHLLLAARRGEFTIWPLLERATGHLLGAVASRVVQVGAHKLSKLTLLHIYKHRLRAPRLRQWSTYPVALRLLGLTSAHPVAVRLLGLTSWLE